MSEGVPEVSVLIPSIGRDTLLSTITSARASLESARISHEIVLVDDSCTGAVEALLAESGIDRAGLRIVPGGARNISIARNLSVEAGRGTYFAFIDDDEWVEPDWAERHREIFERHGADASIGSVQAHYAAGSPPWMIQANLYSRGPKVAGEAVDAGSTANAWVRASCFTRDGFRFDTALGKTGGEDANMFVRLHRAGYRLVSSAARVHEIIPIERASLGNLSQRALRVGHTFAYNTLPGSTRMGQVRFFGRAAVQVVGGVVLAGASLPVSRGRALGYYILALRNLGKLRYLFGQGIVQYY